MLLSLLGLGINAQIKFQKLIGNVFDNYGNSISQTYDEGYIVLGYTKSIGAGKEDVLLIKTNSNGDTLWMKTFGGANDDGGNSIQQTTDGGFIIAGSTTSFGAGGSDVYLIRTNAKGDSLWTKTYGGIKDDEGRSVQPTSDGGYIVSGTQTKATGIKDVYLIKTDANGDSLWTRTFGGVNDEEAYTVQLTSDGGYIICGYTKNFNLGGRDVYLIKTDANGDSIWTRTFGGVNDDEGRSVQQTSEGGYVIGGYTKSFGAGKSDFYLIKTDANGTLTWSKTFGGANDDGAYSIQQTTDGGFVIAGYTTISGNRDAYIIKTDKKGNGLWSKNFGGVNDQVCYSVQETTDGGYIALGYSANTVNSISCGYLLKIDANGNNLWTKKFFDTGDTEGSNIQTTTDGGYIIVGNTNTFGAGNYDIYLIKTNKTGSILWKKTYGGADYDQGSSVLQTSDGGYAVLGVTQSFGAGGRDIYLIKTNSKGDTLWTRTYGGTDYEQGNSIQQTSDGGYIIGGYTISFGVGGQGASYLIKTDSIGEILWTKAYISTYSNNTNSIKLTNDGGYILAGYYYVSNTYADYRPLLIKTDKSGNIIWSKYYQSGVGWAQSVAQNSDSGYILSGTLGTGNGGLLIDVNSSGNILWSRQYGGQYKEQLGCAQQTLDKGFIVVGFTTEGTDGYNAVIIKTNNNGTLAWKKVFGRNGDEEIFSIKQTADRGYITCGAYSSIGLTDNSVYLLKIDSLGNSGCNQLSDNAQLINLTSSVANISFQNNSNMGAINYTSTIVKNENSGISNTFCYSCTLNISPSGSVNLCQGDSVILSTNRADSYLWSNGDTTQSINVFNSGVYSVNIKSDITCSGYSSITTVTVNPLPEVPIIKENITENVVTLTSNYPIGNQWFMDGNIIVNANLQDYIVKQNANYTVQYNDSNGCSATSLPFNINTVNINNPITNENEIIIFPNPSDGIFKIDVGNLRSGKIKIYNIFGESIYQSEIRNETLDLSTQPKGVYLLFLQSGQKIFSKKIVIQ
jgi:hypothetical protein